MEKIQRVVLNLSIEQAKAMEQALFGSEVDTIKKIRVRISKTLTKRMNEAMEPMLGKIVEAAQEVINKEGLQ